ncbi:phospholipid/cholesterol/gamma-HCH transport system substrate-binding protein [Paucimonas lemoignei]|uniref:Phospholipid/cholesterol/gamma-HCH transport system substrate-binding protein n=1 Tax=Paucimonas lemoignei TaxID=29443 RepID=A0A4V2UIX7_PAULE|nr:MlaD family protein [Paucimonas lemoignei]TCS37830.1 phospholipid/cholesterol/gamma-HCH transport system substrate-binding protein [Paucimonas lemoignei]
MENKAHALLAGLFTIVLLAAAVAIAMWLQRDTTEMVPYEIATKLSVPGLSPQAAVRYRGLDVGKVDTIQFDPAVPGQILVRMHVQADTPITQSTYSTLGYQGVTGIAYIQLDDDGSKPVRLPSSDDKVARIEMRPSVFDSLQSKGMEILTQVEEVTRRVNTLLEPDNQKMILQAFHSVGQAANELETIPRQLKPTLAKLPALAEQTNQTLAAVNSLARDVGSLSKSLNTLSGSLQQPNGAIDKLTITIDQVGAVANRIDTEVLPLTNDARSTLRALNRTVDTFRDQPQSLLFGADERAPGPGEAGFTPPQH